MFINFHLQKPHGSPKSENRHAGDLGNVVTPKRGPTKVLVFDSKVTLNPKSKFNILDRAIVVHEKADDLGQVIHDILNL